MTRIILLVAMLVVMATSAYFLEVHLDAVSPPQDRHAFGEAGSIAAILAHLLGVKELMVGYLWLQFDFDSANVLGNYHRLLPTLDAICWLDPGEVEAWALKTFMRVGKAVRTGNVALREAALAEMERATERNPHRWEFPYELGFLLQTRLASPGRALPFIERAAQFPDRHKNVDKLRCILLQKLGRWEEARASVATLLARPDLSPEERELYAKTAQRLASFTPTTEEGSSAP